MANTLDSEWNVFLNSLEENNYREEKKYFEAIKSVSDITLDMIDKLKERENINKSIEIIVNFIEKHKDYYELSKIEGFRINDGNITGRDFYYYIADQQIKATVYYARYLNFIVSCKITSEREKKIRERLQMICKKLCVQQNCFENRVDDICNCLIKCIESNSIPLSEISEKELVIDDLKNIRIELLQYLEECNLSTNVAYKMYMMLNNMMHEIRFFGAAYQYLWHWKYQCKTLYRSGSLESSKDDKRDELIPIYNFMKNMFEECISHMNSPSQIRHSFSENLLIDVYKYLILKKGKSENYNIKNENGLNITSESIKNESEVDFYVIKDASINSIFVNKQSQDFYSCIQNNKEILANCAYSVEVYPQDFCGEKNDKGTVKGMRDTLLPLYFASWDISNVSLSRTKVADDKEVITYGTCYENEVEIESDSNILFANGKSGTLFKIHLNKFDIICLLLKIYYKKKKYVEENEKVIYVVKSLVNKIMENMKYNDELKGRFQEFYDGKDEWCQQLVWNKISSNQFTIDVSVKKEYMNQMSDDDKKTIAIASKQLDDIIKYNVEEYLKNRYEEILNKKNTKIDFIMSTMKDNDFNFWLVSQYNEYMVNEEDAEIAMLKYIIFKEA